MILYRYIIKEHIFPFLVSLSIIVFLFVMQQMVVLLDRIISKGLDPAVVLEIFIIQLGWIIALAIPMAILTATLWCFGRMSGDNEITSIKASGQSLSPLMIPVFSAAAVMAVMLVFFNDLILPDANHRTANLLSDISRTKPAAFIEPGILIRDFTGYTIYTEDVDSRTGVMKGIKIFTDVAEQDPSTTVADSGMVRMTPDEKYLELTLYNGESHNISRKNPEEYFVGKFHKQVICIQNVDTKFQRTTSDYRSDREKSSSMMLTDVAELKKSNNQFISEYNQLLDSVSLRVSKFDSLSQALSDSVSQIDTAEIDTSFQAWAARLDADGRGPTIDMRRHGDYLERLMRRIRSNDLLISEYMVEVHKKFAIPVACLIFVLIGAPLGIMAKRGGLTVGASYSVFFFIAYWAFLIGGETLADKLIISPAVAMWAGNVVIGICGIILTILMLRETTIRFDWLTSWWRGIAGKEQKLVRKLTNNWVFRIPGMLFWAPRWITRKFIRILPTYLISLFLSYVFGVLAAIIVIFVILDYISNLKRFEGVALINIALYYWYYLPWIIQITIPIVLLLASMFSIGKMAKQSELTAMKSSGINVRQLTLPLLFLGIVLSVATFYGGEKILPTANLLRRELTDNMKNPEASVKKMDGIKEFRRNFYYFGNSQTIFFFQEFSTVPQNARNVWRESFDNKQIIQRIQAEKMIYDSTGWRFVNGKIRDFSGPVPVMRNFDTLSDTVLTAVPAEMVARIKSKEEMSYWELRSYIDAAKKRGEKVNKYMGELEFKIALPFMNFIVILLGIAITARTGRKGGAVLFGIGLALMFSYWLISRFAIVFAQNGHLPTLLGAWIGNIIFFVIGLALYRKAAR
ncbi:MAG: YjgP/YjgQ family permease [Fibrobacter sp.]|nr:YjgP/YjgQ family permease [Fibrobacter sp.]